MVLFRVRSVVAAASGHRLKKAVGVPSRSAGGIAVAATYLPRLMWKSKIEL
jgi:hypothetical protein